MQLSPGASSISPTRAIPCSLPQSFQTAVNAYRDAGMPDDSKRARVFLQEKTRQAREQMAPVTTEFTIPREDIDRFCAAVVIDDLGSTFARLAVAFPPHKKKLEERVREAI